jgi:serine protease Do
MQRNVMRVFALFLPLVFAVAACGGGGDNGSAEADQPATTAGAPTTPASTTPASTTPSTEPPATTVAPGTTEPEGSTYADVQPAVIQIAAKGTFRDPEIGYADGSGRGSGFIISPDGLAVTNNHVVAGAATLEVFVGGDTENSYNATILGVSECNDLALIDINESEPLPTLDWYQDEISAGLDVYAAGFPLGDPEFTLTRGIIAKAEAGGDLTGTSSIDHTVEHDAVIRPGNSGGPLVGTDGTVVAVNYAGGGTENTEQFFSIASDLAQPVIDRLRQGDFESLGINGWAVFDEDLGISGIWVAGVAPGSPAADADVLPGDIVTSMNGLPVGTDGTFKDYCDVLRTAGEDAPIAVEVLRFDTSEVMRGEINGDQPIELAFSFADEVGSDVGEDEGAAPTEYEYASLTDDLGRIRVDLPTAWAERDTSPATLDDGTEVPYIAAATKLAGFRDGWDEPGLLFAAMPADTDVDGLLTQYGFADDCTDGGTTDYSDAVFTGKYQLWLDCAGTSTDVVTLIALPEDGSYTAVIQAQIISDADLEALDRAFASFNTAS